MNPRFLPLIMLPLLLWRLQAVGQPTLFYNGRIHTGDILHPLAGYFREENGTITAIGDSLSAEEISRYAKSVNLHGNAVIPGIIDSHIHFVDGGLGALQAHFDDVRDETGFRERLLSTRNDLLDGIYVGRNLGYEPLARVPRPRDLLDELIPHTPAIIFLKSGHAAITNSEGLRLLGMDGGTQPEHGTIVTDASGSATGLLLEEAAMEASKTVSGHFTGETVARAILHAQSLALSYGITAIGDNTFAPYHLKIYQELQHAGLLPIRVRARSYGGIPQTDILMSGLGRPKLGFIGGRNLDRVRYHAVKYFEDMSLSTRADSSNDVVTPGGTTFLDREDLRDILLLHASQPLAFHVQGKQGLENILSTVEQYGTRTKQRRHVIDHAGYASSGQLERISRDGLALTIIGGQTFDYATIGRYYRSCDHEHFLEEDLLDTRRKVLLAGGALSSDFPYGMDTAFSAYPQIDGLNPFPAMAVNTSGRLPDGTPIEGFTGKTLLPEEALVSYTANGAFVLEDEHVAGRLAPGMRADFAILQNDPFAGDPMRLYDAKVKATFIDGIRVYAEDAPPTISTDLPRVSSTEFTVSPVIGYDPSLGAILGAALFVYPLQTPGTYYDVQFQTLLTGKLNVSADFIRYGVWKDIDLSVGAGYSNFFTYYFGEGDATAANMYQKLFAETYRVRPELTFHCDHAFAVGIFADLRGRRETDVTSSDDQGLGRRLFPDEHTLAFGATVSFDTRDNSGSTRKGLLAQSSVSFTPGRLNDAGAGNVLQMSGELRAFRYIYNEDFVLAARLAGGTSFGTPGYLFRYTLGGSTFLRGYYGNRFRGTSFAAGQIETRCHIWRNLYGVAFGDAGDVANGALDHLKTTYGFGIRIALGKSLCLRLDYGIAPDQNGVFFSFGEAF